MAQMVVEKPELRLSALLARLSQLGSKSEYFLILHLLEPQ
jgi:hypothetical protein